MSELLCPTPDSCHRAEETFSVNKKLAQLSESVASVFEAQAHMAAQLDAVRDQLSSRVTKADFEEKLKLKANKQSVVDALQRKANRNEVESMNKMILSLSKRIGKDAGNIEDAKTHLEVDID